MDPPATEALRRGRGLPRRGKRRECVSIRRGYERHPSRRQQQRQHAVPTAASVANTPRGHGQRGLRARGKSRTIRAPLTCTTGMCERSAPRAFDRYARCRRRARAHRECCSHFSRQVSARSVGGRRLRHGRSHFPRDGALRARLRERYAHSAAAQARVPPAEHQEVAKVHVGASGNACHEYP